MKTTRIGLLFAAIITLFILPVAFAAGLDPTSTIVAAPTTVIPVETQNVVLAYFLKFAITHGWAATLFVVVAFCRTWAKPVSSIVHTFIELSPSTKDNEIAGSVTTWFTTNNLGITIAYVIDWITSIKIVPPVVVVVDPATTVTTTTTKVIKP